MGITLLILLLFLVAGGFIIFKYTKTGYTLLVVGFALFYLTASGLLGSLLLNQLESDYFIRPTLHWGQRNAIILLGAGTVNVPPDRVEPTLLAYSRIYTAASLYTACHASGHACTIIVSGGDAAKTGQSEAIVYKEALQKLTVKNTDIKLEPNSMNTYQNAEFTKPILAKGDYDRVFLTTSAVHLKRSLMYFANFDIHPIPVAADYMLLGHSLMPTGYHFAMTDFAFHEYFGMLQFHVYNFLGWNKKK